jgi:predicted nucleic acid-binding protein
VTLRDVNLWVYAFRSDSPLHAIARAELDDAGTSGDAHLLCPWVAVSLLRLVTNPRIFVHPSGIDEAWGFADSLESRARAVRTEIDPMTCGVFKHLCLVEATPCRRFWSGAGAPAISAAAAPPPGPPRWRTGRRLSGPWTPAAPARQG